MSISAMVRGDYNMAGNNPAIHMFRLDITGLSLGPNVIPHHLSSIAVGWMPSSGAKIWREDVLLTSDIQVHQTQPADSTNLYYTMDAGPGSTVSVWVWI
jgi:hypothetical protein